MVLGPVLLAWSPVAATNPPRGKPLWHLARRGVRETRAAGTVPLRLPFGYDAWAGIMDVSQQ